MLIHPQPLTAEEFRPFGEVIETAGHVPVLINRGHTEKFADLANLLAGADGHMTIHVYRSKPAVRPLVVRGLERHPLGSQAFIPLHDRPFPVLVAPNVAGGAAQPDIAAIRLFLTNGSQGFNLKPGTWHHFQLSLDAVSDYLVIDRKGKGVNLEEFELPEALTLAL